MRREGILSALLRRESEWSRNRSDQSLLVKYANEIRKPQPPGSDLLREPLQNLLMTPFSDLVLQPKSSRVEDGRGPNSGMWTCLLRLNRPAVDDLLQGQQ